MMKGKHGETAETFERQMFKTVQSGFTSVSVAMGSATGLFNTMATLGEAKTSKEIADAAGLKERYVREWLGAVVAPGIVDVDSDDDTYYLPPHRHNALCTEHGDGTLPAFCEAVPVICEVYKDIRNCFQKDGPKGVPMSRYTLFHQWMDTVATGFLKGQPPVFLTDNDKIRAILETSSTVCDVGCGSGAALCYLARDFPKCQFLGIEMSEEAVAAAKSRAARMQLSNVAFDLGDAIKMAEVDAWKSKFDVVFCMDVVHDVGRPDLLLKGIRSIVKDDGFFVMKDVGFHTKQADNIDHPWATVLYTISLFHCMPASLSYGDDSFGLGAAWGRERALEMLKETGFVCFQTNKTNVLNEDFYCKKS